MIEINKARKKEIQSEAYKNFKKAGRLFVSYFFWSNVEKRKAKNEKLRKST